VCAIDLEGDSTDNGELNNIDAVEQAPEGVFEDENLDELCDDLSDGDYDVLDIDDELN
jgi:hypothetical protein